MGELWYKYYYENAIIDSIQSTLNFNVNVKVNTCNTFYFVNIFIKHFHGFYGSSKSVNIFIRQLLENRIFSRKVDMLIT